MLLVQFLKETAWLSVEEVNGFDRLSEQALSQVVLACQQISGGVRKRSANLKQEQEDKDDF